MTVRVLPALLLGLSAIAAHASVERSFDLGRASPRFVGIVRPGALDPGNAIPDQRRERLRSEISQLTVALETEGSDAEAFYRRGMAYAEWPDHDRAIADFDEAIRLKPEYAEAFHEKGRNYAAKGELDRAIQSYDRAIALKPTYGEAYDNRGRIHARRRQFDRALADYDHAIRIDPFDARSLNDACWIRAIANRELELGLSNCDQAVSLKPLNGNYWDSRGFIHFRMGRYAEAIADYDAALSRRLDERAPSLYMRGIAKLRMGDTTGAMIDINGGRTLNPRVAAQFASYGVRP